MHDDKRQLRELKRAVKRSGNKHRRNALKRQLQQDPEAAHVADEDFGGRESRNMNGLDRPVYDVGIDLTLLPMHSFPRRITVSNAIAAAQLGVAFLRVLVGFVRRRPAVVVALTDRVGRVAHDRIEQKGPQGAGQVVAHVVEQHQVRARHDLGGVTAEYPLERIADLAHRCFFAGCVDRQGQRASQESRALTGSPARSRPWPNHRAS